MSDKESLEIEEKLTVEQVLEYYKNPSTPAQVASRFNPNNTDRLHHDRHSHVVFTVFDPAESIPFALIKPGPLSKAEQDMCLLLFSPVRRVSRTATAAFLRIIESAEDSNQKNGGPAKLVRGRSDLRCSFLYLENELKNYGPFSKKEYTQLSLQVAKDAKDGGWFSTYSLETINKYSLAGNSLNASLDLSDEDD